jgi:iron complex outermembrane receptor protein
MEMVDSKWDYTNGSGKITSYDLSDILHTKLGAVGFQFNYKTDNDWQITNNFRYQTNNTSFNSTLPLGVQQYASGVDYTYLDGRATVYSASDYNVFAVALVHKNKDTQIMNFLDFKKKVKKHSLGMGVSLHQFNVNNEPNDAFVYFQELKENPRRLIVPAFGFTGNGMLPASSSIAIADTRILSS